MSSFRRPFSTSLGLERMEAREVPATFVVNTEADLPDDDLTDGIPKCGAVMVRGAVVPLVSLRSVIMQMNEPGNGNQTHTIVFANTVHQVFYDKDGHQAPADPTAEMTIPLASQLPDVIANRKYVVTGSSDRRVTITRSSDEGVIEKFRFFDVVAGGQLTLDGLKITGANNDTVGGFGGAVRNAGVAP
jgi:hypothetical protein